MWKVRISELCSRLTNCSALPPMPPAACPSHQRRSVPIDARHRCYASASPARNNTAICTFGIARRSISLRLHFIVGVHSLSLRSYRRLGLDLLERNATFDTRSERNADTVTVFAIQRRSLSVTAVGLANNNRLATHRQVAESNTRPSPFEVRYPPYLFFAPCVEIKYSNILKPSLKELFTGSSSVLRLVPP